MKICVLGLDCAAPEIIFGDERLVNLRRLMDAGVYGRLESVIPPITVPAWMCMSTSQDPGSLGVYGFRNRVDHSYDKLGFANSASIKALAIWDQLAREGKRSILVGVPPNYPPRRIHGISIGCFLTPDTTKNDFTHPTWFKTKINDLVGDYPVDVKNFRTDRKDWLKDEIFKMSEKQWRLVHWLLQNEQWDYFHFVDIGLDGGIAINQWLIREGLLVLHEYPKTLTQFDKLKVDWTKTRVWSEGGYYARVFFNVQGREPNGVIPQNEYESFQSEMKARLENLPDNEGNQLQSRVFKPKELYHSVRNVAPDLIVHFGGLYWRSIGSVGHAAIHVQENDTGPDGCNHAQNGMFILAAPNCPLSGEYQGARLLDIAPTLLDLAGYEVPDSMQGRSLVAGMEKKSGSDPGEGDQIIHDRLAGLGYV